MYYAFLFKYVPAVKFKNDNGNVKPVQMLAHIVLFLFCVPLHWYVLLHHNRDYLILRAVSHIDMITLYCCNKENE